LASSKVDAFSKVKGTKLGIFVSKESITYCWSFLSAALCASGRASVSGCWSLWPLELSVMVTVFICLLPFLFACLEFFASLAEAHTFRLIVSTEFKWQPEVFCNCSLRISMMQLLRMMTPLPCPLGIWGFGIVRSCSISIISSFCLVSQPIVSRSTASATGCCIIPCNTFSYAVDLIGYSYMSLSTFSAAFVFSREWSERLFRWFMIANGLILPFLAFQTYFPSLIWSASLCSIMFPGSTILLAIFFKRKVDRDKNANLNKE